MTKRLEPQEINENQTGILTTTSDGSTVTFLDANGSPVTLANMVSITMTYIDLKSGDTINSRLNQDALNANNFTYHATSGLFTWDMQPGDVAIVNSETPVGGLEKHLAVILFVWDSGNEKLPIEILIKVRDLEYMPVPA